MNDVLIYGIGFIAQLLFTSRTFIQWFISEKKKAVANPIIFWYLSLLAACIMIAYGILRSDGPIILGQLIPYFIYVRNIQLKEKWYDIPQWIRFIILSLPLLALLIVIFFYQGTFHRIFTNEEIPLYLFILGVVGQVLFTMRFVLQWLHSEKKKKSELPPLFWWTSIGGSALILIYGILRIDPVLILGHCTGLIVYFRNIYLWFRSNGKL